MGTADGKQGSGEKAQWPAMHGYGTERGRKGDEREVHLWRWTEASRKGWTVLQELGPDTESARVLERSEHIASVAAFIC